MKIQKKTKIIVLIIGVTFASLVATQTFAKYTGYNNILGGFRIGKINIYFPFNFFSWLTKYRKYAPIAADKAQTSFLITILFFILLLIVLTKEKKVLSSHGTSDFANKEDIEKMDLLPSHELIIKNYKRSKTYDLYKKTIGEDREDFWVDGAFIGRDDLGRDLLDNTPHPVSSMAPTRSGKGISQVITTLLTWKDSVLVNDIKGENWELTSAYRKSIGQKCLKFKPTSLNSCHYNPLVEIRKGTVYEYEEARNIAEIIISPDPTKDAFFGPSAVNYLTAVILHVLWIKEDEVASLTDIYNWITSPSQNIEQKLESMRITDHNNTDNPNLFSQIYGNVVRIDNEPRPLIHPIVSAQGADMKGRADNERSGIISSAITNLTVFITPTIAKNIQDSDFRINDLMNSEFPVSLYFVVPPKDLKITGVLMKILITQIIFILTAEMKFSEGGQNNAYLHKLLLLIDEFPALGRMSLFHDAISYVAGYGIKPFLICQDINQLNKIYGKDNSFISNCRIRSFYTPNDTNTPQFVEKMLGNKTIIQTNKSWSGNKFFSKVNYSESEISRPLMTAAEISQMSDKNTLLFVTGQKPIKGIKARWYQEDKFKKRQKIMPYKDESDTLSNTK